MRPVIAANRYDSSRGRQGCFQRKNAVRSRKLECVLLEELFRLVDLGGKVGASASVRVVQQHQRPVGLADLVFRDGALAVEEYCQRIVSCFFLSSFFLVLLLLPAPYRDHRFLKSLPLGRGAGDRNRETEGEEGAEVQRRLLER